MDAYILKTHMLEKIKTNLFHDVCSLCIIYSFYFPVDRVTDTLNHIEVIFS